MINIRKKDFLKAPLTSMSFSEEVQTAWEHGVLEFSLWKEAEKTH